jgi:hypothetical protein
MHGIDSWLAPRKIFSRAAARKHLRVGHGYLHIPR